MAKLGFGRPKYASEELYDFRGETVLELFLGIIRLAKTKRNTVINYEFDSPSAIFNDENATHRHYAVAHGKNLPKEHMDFEVDLLKITLRDLVL